MAKKLMMLFGLLMFAVNVNAFNVTFDCGNYQCKVLTARGYLVGIYTNETINMGINDYIVILEERPLNLSANPQDSNNVILVLTDLVSSNIIPLLLIGLLIIGIGLFIFVVKWLIS